MPAGSSFLGRLPIRPQVKRLLVLFVLSAAALTAALSLPIAVGAPVPGAPACEIFPADNPWNRRVDSLPVHDRSDEIIRSIGRREGLHPDFGSGKWNGGPIGIPFTTVPGDQERVDISFRYDDESDPGPYPIPDDAPIEGGPDSDGDRHVIVIDRDECILYEVFAARQRDDGTWRAGSGAVWDLNSNALRPRGWTSADAAGLAILPGLARFNEVESGEIHHALRFTVEQTRRAYVYPARHFASDLTSRNLPAMGQRLRLKKSFDISGFDPQPQIILRALKRYGMILADNGSDWYISGAPSPGWDNDALHVLGEVEGRHFEVVKAGSLRPES